MESVVARGLVKRFGSVTAVDGVSLHLGAGEVRGLLGANGAGKTTLLRLLLGLIAPDHGDVQLLGRPLRGPGSAALDHVGGFVEDPTFYPYLSALANLSLLSRLDGRRPSRSEALALLARVDLAGHSAERVGGFSTGMRQRLGIAAALLRAPQLLLLDEPTSGLDPAGSRDVARLVRELAGDGVAVLLSSHRIGELERICDHYTFMRQGRVVWDGRADELTRTAPASAYEMRSSDDGRAAVIAAAHPLVAVTRADNGSLRVSADDADLDAFVLALGRASVAVRRLELVASPLESMFFALSEDQGLDGSAARAIAPGPARELAR